MQTAAENDLRWSDATDDVPDVQPVPAAVVSDIPIDVEPLEKLDVHPEQPSASSDPPLDVHSEPVPPTTSAHTVPTPVLDFGPRTDHISATPAAADVQDPPFDEHLTTVLLGCLSASPVNDVADDHTVLSRRQVQNDTRVFHSRTSTDIRERQSSAAASNERTLVLTAASLTYTDEEWDIWHAATRPIDLSGPIWNFQDGIITARFGHILHVEPNNCGADLHVDITDTTSPAGWLQPGTPVVYMRNSHTCRVVQMHPTASRRQVRIV